MRGPKTAERAKTGGPGRYERPKTAESPKTAEAPPTKAKNKPGWVVEPGPAGQIRIATQRYSAVAALIFLSMENMMRAAMKQSAIRMVQLAMSGTLSHSIEGMELR